MRRRGADEPRLEILAIEGDIVSAKIPPGHRWNASGIRGMSDIRYEPARIVVFRRIGVERDGTWRI
jgi:hypothetical protein